MRPSTAAPAAFALVLAVLTLVHPAPAAAQEFGVRAGASWATISFSPGSDAQDLPGADRQTGFAGGVSVFLTHGRGGGLQLEGLVVRKGARNLLRRDDSIRLTYLEIPLLLHVDVAQRGDSATYLVVGPSVAFNLQASYEEDGVTEDIKDDIETFDAGFSVGGGFEAGPVVIDLRYTWGLRRVFEVGDLDGAFRNRAFTATAGFRVR